MCWSAGSGTRACGCGAGLSCSPSAPSLRPGRMRCPSSTSGGARSGGGAARFGWPPGSRRRTGKEGPWPRAAGPFPGGCSRCGRLRRATSLLPSLPGLTGFARVPCLAVSVCNRSLLDPIRPSRPCFRRPPYPPGGAPTYPSFGRGVGFLAGRGWPWRGGGLRDRNGCSIGVSRGSPRQNALNRTVTAVRLDSHLGPAIPASLLMRWEPHDPIYLRNRRGGFLAG